MRPRNSSFQLFAVSAAVVLAASLQPALATQSEGAQNESGVKEGLGPRVSKATKHATRHGSHAAKEVVPMEPAAAPTAPHDCLSYSMRFEPYLSPPKQPWNPNANKPHAEVVVLLKLFHRIEFQRDMVLNLRAFVAEVGKLPSHHVFLLYDSPADDLELTFYKAHVPPEFSKVLVPFNNATMVHTFPDGYRADLIPMGYTNYLVAAWFMHKHPQYRFAWELEYDVMYTGHWDRFFAYAEAYAAAMAPEADPKPVKSRRQSFRRHLLDEHLISAHSGDKSKQEAPQAAAHAAEVRAFSEPAASQLPLPDFVTFAPILLATQSAYDDTYNFNFSIEHHKVTSVMIYGCSQRMYEVMYGYARLGHIAYAEVFPPSIASLNSYVSVEVPHEKDFGGNATFNCCFPEQVQALYQKWKAGGPEECQESLLIHPGKEWTMWSEGDPATFVDGKWSVDFRPAPQKG